MNVKIRHKEKKIDDNFFLSKKFRYPWHNS